MKKVLVLVLVVCTLLTVLSTTSFAASPWTTEETYGDKVKGKLFFGLRNILFGWGEFLVEPVEAFDNGENIFAGIGKGLLYPVVDTFGGAAHLLTAPFTFDIPLPENGTKF